MSVVAGCSSSDSSKPAAPMVPISSTTAPANVPVVAIVNGRPIPREQFEKVLVEAYGLNVLLNVVQLELARQQADQAKITVTQADADHEQELTLKEMFKDAPKEEYPQLLDSFLTQRRITRAEFDLVMMTNAYLRKLAEPLIKGKATDENLQEAFRALYGATVQVRHIQASNLQEISVARERLKKEPFEKVASEMSRDATTAPLGGELPPFSMQTPGLAQSFKETAFELKEGEVSETVQANGAWHIIKLEKKIAPKAVKYEDVKDNVRETLYTRWTVATMAELRQRLAQAALQSMDIKDPILRRQFEDRMFKQQAAMRDRQKAEEQITRDREKLQHDQDFREGPTTARAATQSAAPIMTSPMTVSPGISVPVPVARPTTSTK